MWRASHVRCDFCSVAAAQNPSDPFCQAAGKATTSFGGEGRSGSVTPAVWHAAAVVAAAAAVAVSRVEICPMRRTWPEHVLLMSNICPRYVLLRSTVCLHEFWMNIPPVFVPYMTRCIFHHMSYTCVYVVSQLVLLLFCTIMKHVFHMAHIFPACSFHLSTC